MTVRRIGLLLCGHVDPKSTHIAGDYPELFASLLRDESLELVRFDVDRGHFPASLDDCEGWICSPSRQSVYDELEWIDEARDLHREVIRREVPYVGICFGHQLLADALGAPVQRATHGWNVGVHEYVIDAPQPWMGGDAAPISLLASHQDQVLELPADATLLAHAPDGSCPIGGMVIGERAWTVQLHPEFVPELADHLLAGRVDLIGADEVRSARATLDWPLSSARVARWIGTFFRSNSLRPLRR